MASVNFDNIPSELRVLPNWVLWRIEQRDDKPTKVPIDKFGQHASSTASHTWCHFDEAKVAFEHGVGNCSGIGFVFTRENNITGVDLDHCRDKGTGVIDTWATVYLDKLNSYTEVSPSGAGLHVILKGILPEDVKGKKKNLTGEGYQPKAAIEMYSEGRFFTFTGQRAEDHPSSLENRQDELTGIFEELFPKKSTDEGNRNTSTNSNLSDEQIISLATKAKNGDKFQRLMRGNTSGYKSDSEADSALCCILVYYTRDKAQIVRIVQTSGLWDKKWDRPDYQDKTIDNALALVIEGYTSYWTTSKPAIMITADLPQLIDQTLEVLHHYNEPPIIFQRGGSLCRIQHTDDNVRIQDLNADMLRPEVAQAANFFESRIEEVEGKTVKAPVLKMPPMPVIKSILVQRSYDMPTIKGIISSPVLRHDGSMLLETGYDVATGLYYHSTHPLVMPDIPSDPTKEDAIAAAKFIVEEILYDFPFDGDPHTANASRDNAIAALISPIVRPMIKGNMPLYLVDKPSAGTGASLLMTLISIVATGEQVSASSCPDNEEEWRKQISSWLRDGNPLICLDNIASDLRSHALSRALTAAIWRDRILGKPDAATYPNMACWFANGNGLTLGGDLPRRSYLSQLDAKRAKPWERKQTDFHHANIIQWVKDNRAKILAAIMTMARAWVVAGKPAGNHTKVLGGYEQFTDIVGGILAYAGVGKFLSNQDVLYDNLDAETEEWDLFWNAWWLEFKDNSQSSKDVLDKITGTSVSDMKALTPSDISEKIKYAGAGDAIKLGRVLRKKVNVVTKNGFKLTKEEDKHCKSTRWKLTSLTEKSEKEYEQTQW